MKCPEFALIGEKEKQQQQQQKKPQQNILLLLYLFSSSSDTPASFGGMVASPGETNVSNIFIEDEIQFIRAEAEIFASELR